MVGNLPDDSRDSRSGARREGILMHRERLVHGTKVVTPSRLKCSPEFGLELLYKIAALGNGRDEAAPDDFTDCLA